MPRCLVAGCFLALSAQSIAEEPSAIHFTEISPMPEVTVRAPPQGGGLSPAAMSPGGIGADAPVAVDEPGGASRLDDTLVGMGWASWDAANSLGLGAGLNVRGFTLNAMGAPRIQASHVFLDGYADIGGCTCAMPPRWNRCSCSSSSGRATGAGALRLDSPVLQRALGR